MPFNGTGMFVRLRNWVADAAAGIKIRADYHDIEDDSFADGLSQCIARDGQSIILNNIPMNGKRLTALQDPVDPQDTATKAYADTKLPLAGGSISGSLTVAGQLTAAGVFSTGYRTRTGTPGPYGASWFNFNWTGAAMDIWVDNSNTGTIATQAYAESRASAWAATRLPLAGGTITGPLTVNGEMVAAASYLRFNYAGSPGYIQWNGGGNYGLGGGGTIWCTGNLPGPVTSGRLVNAGNLGPGNGTMNEVAGAVVTGLAGTLAGTTGVLAVTSGQIRYLQLLTPSGWFTVSIA